MVAVEEAHPHPKVVVEEALRVVEGTQKAEEVVVAAEVLRVVEGARK